MESNFRRNLIVSSTISVLILVISSTASFLSINSLLESNAQVNHTQEIIYNLNSSQRIVLDAQSGVRGFLVTGNDMFLNRYLQSSVELDAVIKKLEELTADNKVQQAHIRAIKTDNNDNKDAIESYMKFKEFFKLEDLYIEKEFGYKFCAFY